MRANLDADGCLASPPRSVAEARARLAQIGLAIEQIQAQLADGSRVAAMTRRAYARWRARAQANLGWLRAEREQIAAWLGGQVEDKA